MSIVDYISNLDRPSYAPSFDGVFFEDVVPGYRTLDVTGREPIQASVKELSSEIRDGALFVLNRREARDIVVKFAITTDSQREYLQSVDKLKALITSYNVDYVERTEKQVIFSDESDRYYMGVVTNLELEKFVDYNSGSGQFTIHCADPLKYSVEEFAVPLSDGNVAEFDYDGTHYSYPRIKVFMQTGYTDKPTSGFSLINQDGKILQVGTMEEVELPEGEEPKTKSEYIFTDSFSSAIPEGWTVNTTAINNLIKCSDWFQATGTMAVNGGVLKVTDYGTAPASNGWYGPVLTRTSNFSDSQSSSNHKSGTLEFKHRMVVGSNDYGEFVVTLNHHQTVDGVFQRTAIAKLVFFKKTKGSNKASCNLMIYSPLSNGGRLVDTFTFDAGSNGNITKASRVNNAGPATHKITKIEDKIVFEINGQSQYSFTDNAIKDMTIDSVSFAIAKYKSNVEVTVNYLYSAQFTSHSVKDIKEIPNKLPFGSNVYLDVSKAEIKVDDTVQHDVGALGNDWETFFIKPGHNVINFYHTDDWLVGMQALPVTIYYRKVYL